jgi:hypothetical protein
MWVDVRCEPNNFDSFQDKNTPAIVSLAAGGVAGGVEGFLSVCSYITEAEICRVTETIGSTPWNLQKHELNYDKRRVYRHHGTRSML